MSPEKGRGKYPAPPYTPGENTPGRFGVRCRWRFGFFTCHRKMYFMCPIGQEHGTHPSTLPGTPPGLCRVPRYPSNPAPRHPRRGGVPVRGAISPGGAPIPNPGGKETPFSRFRVPGTGGATTRPGCFRPVCLFDTHRRRGFSMNTRPLSGVVGYRDTFPPLPVSFFRCFRVVDIGTPAPFRGFPFRGKHPPYRHRCRETFRGGILSRPTMMHGNPPFFVGGLPIGYPSEHPAPVTG